jgi:ABC-type transport system involved in multi-copper enzyme maturation permease subunit
MRNRLLWLSLLVVAVSFGLVEFIGDLAITEHRVTQVAVLAAFLRLSSVVILAMFVVSSTVRELQDKTLEMILAMPIHRSSYYLGKLTGFVQVAVIIVVIFSTMLMLYAPVEQVMIWGISLLLELVLVVALGLVMLFTFNQIPAALAGVFIIYAASRTATSIYLMAKYPIIAHTSTAQKFMDSFVELLTWLLPDLHRFTQTEWLAHGTGEFAMLVPVLGQTMIYLLLLSAIALFDFYRKNF